MNKATNILVISPVRDEAEYLGGVIRSMVNQTIRPAAWVIVDDGSQDATARLAARAAEEHDWIHLIRKTDRGERAVGPGVVEAFYQGMENAPIQDYDYVCKLDGDIEFGPRYFETLLALFAEDERLGAASGKPFIESSRGLVPERTRDEMVAGQINFYRRACFEDIGGFVRQVHWDGIAFHMARIKGWKTRSVSHPDLDFLHKRIMGSSHKGLLHGRMRWGRGQYFMGTHPLYVIAIGVYRSMERPFLFGGLAIILGYVLAYCKGFARFEYPGFRRNLRRWQLNKLKALLSGTTIGEAAQ